ncbi:MAG: hypothetical protein H2060_01120 [Azoarcus sp.]|nr:hypothetical protein [Azoarcus sp.]
MPPASTSSTRFGQRLYGPAGFTLLILLYLVPGVIGHGPWRGDDVEHFAIVHGLLAGEWLLYPTLAGQPEGAFGPLHYWISAVFALALGWLLPVHDAARLATPAMAVLATFWIARASARLHGRQTRSVAALLIIGTLGLAVHVHENQPMVTLMMTQALTLAGLALTPERPLRGSLQAAAGTLLAFLAAGPAGMLLTLPLMLIAATCSAETRNPRTSGALILSLSLALGGCALWPVALGSLEPAMLDLWWQQAWADLARDPLHTAGVPRLLELLAWFTWPLWPIAMWSVWRARRQLARLSWLLPLCATVLALAWVFLQGSFNAAAMLPLAPPLALLAAAGLPTLRRGAANAFDWFAVMTFGVFAGLVWLAWSAQVYAWPPGLARSLDRMAPEFVLTGTGLQAGLGIFIVLVWIVLVRGLPRSFQRGSTNWALGMTMLWCLTVTLLLPWFDHTRNYRPVAESLARALADERALCVATLGLTRSHRATLDYYTGLRPQRVRENETTCRYLVTFDDELNPGRTPSWQWREIWEYRHAGGKRLEVFRLYRRD